MEKIVLEHCISQRVMDPIKGKALIKQQCLSGLNKAEQEGAKGCLGCAVFYGQPLA